MKQITKINVEYPIFDACLFKNVLVTCGGGGGQKFGIQNKLEMLNSSNLKTYQNLNNDLLFQQVQVVEQDDLIIANTDLNIHIYKVFIDKIQLIKEIKFEEGKLYEILVHVQNDLLIYQTPQQLVSINQIENNTLIDLFEIQMNEQIINLIAIVPLQIIAFCLQRQILLFCLKTKTFIQKIVLEQNLSSKIFLEYDQNEKNDLYFYIIDSQQKQTQMYVYMYQNSNLKLVNKIILCQHKISAYKRYKNLIVASTSDGEILLYNFVDDITSLIKSIKSHNFPISKFIIRKMINFEKDKSYNVISFGTDSIINSFEIKFEELFRKYMIFIILFLAFLLGFLLRGNKQTNVIQEINQIIV